MDIVQQERVALNEALFRRHNEAISDAVGDFDIETPTISFMCECAITECRDMIGLSQVEYRGVREDPSRFVVRPDHMLPDAERVVERHDRYWVVEKTGAGRAVAVQDAIRPDADTK